MSKERNAFKAGLFIVIAVGLAIAIVISIKGVGQLAGPRTVHMVSFKLADDVGGLRVGDDVRIGGMKVGSVREVDLIGADGGAAAGTPTILVKFMLPSDVALREGAQIGVQTTLTGSSVLNIETVGTGAVQKPGSTVFAGAPDPKASLLASLGRLGPQLEGTVADAKTAVAEVKTRSLPKLNATIDRAGEAMAEFRDTLGPSKTDYHGTIANLNATTAELKKRLPGMLENTEKAIVKLEGSLTKVQTALDDVTKTMANARDLTAATREVVAGNKGKLHALVASLKTTADNLKAASAEIRRSPWRLLYKPAPNEMANLNIYDSARQFADGASALEDAATALRDAVQQKDANPEQVKQLIGKLDETFAGFKQVEAKLWSEVKE